MTLDYALGLVKSEIAKIENEFNRMQRLKIAYADDGEVKERPLGNLYAEMKTAEERIIELRRAIIRLGDD